MSQPFDIVGYAYRADLYCGGCVVKKVCAIEKLDTPDRSTYEEDLYELSEAMGIDKDDEAAYDSDDFPKVMFRDQADEDDRCSGCGAVLE